MDDEPLADPERRMGGGRLGTICFGLLMVVAAIGFMIWDHQRIARASAWPSVRGRIVESSYSSRGTGTILYEPHLLYEYRVGTRNFRHHAIWLTARQSFESTAAIEAFLRPWPVGAAVPVHYNPADPRDAALLIDRQGGPMVFIILIGLLVMAGGWYWPRLVARFDDGRGGAG